MAQTSTTSTAINSSTSASEIATHHEITITVLYFAAAHSATGLEREPVQLPLPAPAPAPASDPTNERSESGFILSALPALLSSLHPHTKLEEILQTCQWSVNAEMVDDPDTVWLTGGEEVGVICPVSGG